MPEPITVDFTVVIPAFNPGSMLRDALASVSAQTHPPAWVVVIDDGSTDGTSDAASTWLAEFGLRGELVVQQNRGISAARNAGLDHRRSQVIALLDADDVWLPGHLANLHEAYLRCPDAIVAFGDSRFFGDSRSRTDLLARKVALQLSSEAVTARIHRLSKQVFDRSLPGQFFPISASSFRMDRSTPEPRFQTDLPVGEDRYLFLQLARLGPFVFIDEQSCRTRRHESNTTHSDKDIWLREQALMVLEKIRRDADLALTSAEVSIVDHMAKTTAAALLYASSVEGLATYQRARQTVKRFVPNPDRSSLRDLGRAMAATVGLSRRRMERPKN